ncbi:enolase member 4 [Schistosoma haematobium]|uniref:phosphopyruvate hydratase n=1 Tax=Schistosoma haematobium TaxID=6185 RepID=A0A922IJ90_SCHHA|nr:enolase member 4 [Schistosoma haematobium]KAH9580821.1 enolase member 4 [Schistosoma haematobium]
MDIKTRAIEYFSNNNILKELENALQLMFQENTSDHSGYLSKYFEKISLTPKVVSIKVDRNYSYIGTFSSSLSVLTLWRTNIEVTTGLNYVYGCNYCLPYGNILNESTPSEFSVCIEAVVDLLDNCLWSPAEMFEIDKYIRNFYNEYRKQLNKMQTDESEKEIEVIGPKEIPLKSTSEQNAKKKSTKDIITLLPNQIISIAPFIATDLTWLSISLHLTAMKCSRPKINFQWYMKSLYDEVIKSTMPDNKPNSPIPVNQVTCPIITILNCPGRIGSIQSGKCKFLQEILLIPKPYLTPKELLDNLFIIKTKLSQTLMNKPNLIPQLICDNGASSVNIDKPEQAFDLLIEFLEQIQLNNHFYFGLFISPKGIFDTIKERYEIITGNLKTPEELVNYYIDLIGRYPQIRLLIDPFRVEDKEYWELLKTRITSSILITTSTIIQPAMKEITLNRSNSMITKNLKTITTLSSFDEPLKFSIPTGLTIYDLVNSCQGNKVHHHKDDVNHVDIDTTTTTTTNNNNNNIKQIPNGALQSTSLCNTVDKQDMCYSSWLFTMDPCLDCVLITEIIQAIHILHLQNRQVIFSLDNLQVIEDWPMDMAIGLGIDFIKITGLNRIDQMNKLITWYHYYQDIIDHLKDSINEWKLYDSSLMENSFNV